MSNIDKRALREAAEKATPGRIGDRVDGSIKYTCRGTDGTLVLSTDNHDDYGFVGDNSLEDELFFRLCDPVTVLAMLDEIAELEQRHCGTALLEREEMHTKTLGRMLDELDAKDRRIAELEAREIKPVNGEVLVTVAGFTGCGKSAIAGEIEIAMKAIGVPVQWANGDAEKRMTGADWLTAIEMYKPSVRIVEVNVPRAAAGKGE
ncbi:ead/Ea22-like family protein [Enterobacter kobei]|uniref:ead/Ea22-like family protein n=1 Tax=Enterobacter kobei TaxID=208224 RepID=UPI0020756F86|nr:ead/Ea22-like family protein [Enterobacter kobei]MCM7802348.1 ead/Ea22-like family protein [Enterobacter kobei]